jgi:hypothetical protein
MPAVYLNRYAFNNDFWSTCNGGHENLDKRYPGADLQYKRFVLPALLSCPGMKVFH